MSSRTPFRWPDGPPGSALLLAACMVPIVVLAVVTLLLHLD